MTDLAKSEAYLRGVEDADLSWVDENNGPYPVFSREYADWLAGLRHTRRAEEPEA